MDAIIHGIYESGLDKVIAINSRFQWEKLNSWWSDRVDKGKWGVEVEPQVSGLESWWEWCPWGVTARWANSNCAAHLSLSYMWDTEMQTWRLLGAEAGAREWPRGRSTLALTSVHCRRSPKSLPLAPLFEMIWLRGRGKWYKLSYDDFPFQGEADGISCQYFYRFPHIFPHIISKTFIITFQCMFSISLPLDGEFKGKVAFYSFSSEVQQSLWRERLAT